MSDNTERYEEELKSRYGLTIEVINDIARGKIDPKGRVLGYHHKDTKEDKEEER